MARIRSLRRLWEPFTACRASLYASSSSFYILLSVFPAALFLLSLLPYLPLSLDALLDALEQVVPNPFHPVVGYVFDTVRTSSTITLLSVSAVTTLWSASKGVLAITDGLNAVLNRPPGAAIPAPPPFFGALFSDPGRGPADHAAAPRLRRVPAGRLHSLVPRRGPRGRADLLSAHALPLFPLRAPLCPDLLFLSPAEPRFPLVPGQRPGHLRLLAADFLGVLDLCQSLCRITSSYTAASACCC